MFDELKQLLIQSGASLVGFAEIEHLYNACDLSLPRGTDSVNQPIDIPHYPCGVSIALAIPREIVAGITVAPTREYFNAYHQLNQKLDSLAEMCADYLQNQGYEAYAQTVHKVKEFGVFRTVMPHKTVAVNAGLGWIGKSALFITEEYGSAVRLTSVLTNAPLNVGIPTKTSKCGACMICTNACPAQAISGKVWEPALERDEFFNAMGCRLKAREIAAKSIHETITLCGKCIEVCPYTQRYILQKQC